MDCSSENRLLNRAYLKYLIPGIIAYLFGQFAPFVDSLVVSRRLGDSAFSAIGLAFPLFYLYNVCGMLFGIGGGAGISQAIGAGNIRRAKRIFTRGLVCSIVISLFCTAGGLIFLPQLVTQLGATSENRLLVATYLKIILYGAPLYIFTLAMFEWLYNANAPRLAMYGMCLSNIVNIVLDILFILYWDFGVAGAAWATVLGLLAETIVYLFYFVRPHKYLSIDFSRDSASIVPPMLVSGLPDGLTYFLKFLRMWIINLLLLLFCGNSGIIVGTLINSFIIVMTVVIIGITSPIIPITGVLFGEKNCRGVEETQRIALRYACGLLLPVLLFFIVCPNAFLWAFSITDSESVVWSAPSIRLISMSIFIGCINSIVVARCVACGKSGISLQTVALREFFLLVPLAWGLGAIWNVGGICLAFVISELATLLWLIFVKKQFRDVFSNKSYNTIDATGGSLSPQNVVLWQNQIVLPDPLECSESQKSVFEPLAQRANAGDTSTVALSLLQTNDHDLLVLLSAKQIVPDQEPCMALYRKIVVLSKQSRSL